MIRQLIGFVLLLAVLLFIAACSGGRYAMLPMDKGELERQSGSTTIDETWIFPLGSNAPGTAAAASSDMPTCPTLVAVGEDVVAPISLLHTDVSAKISGFVAAVDVAEQFQNSSDQAVEAEYLFPLPASGSVTDFLMTIGKRHIRGIIRRREEAERIYEQAKAQGFTVSLVSEQRPNLFTQSIANLEPHSKIEIHLQYSHSLSFNDGYLEWSFPMRIPHATTRSGKDVAIAVQLDPGFLCEITANQPCSYAMGRGKQMIIQSNIEVSIANEDFRLRYKIAGGGRRSTLFVQRDTSGGGYFALMLLSREPMSDLALQAGSAKIAEVFPETLPVVAANVPVVLTGRFTGEPPTELILTAKSKGEVVTIPVAVSGISDNGGIEMIWARMKIAALEEAAGSKGADVLEEIIHSALVHHLVSPFTAILAVDTTAP